jgi:hypothetical protein
MYRCTDFLLCFPVYWFLVLSFYSLLVCLRCFYTLRREYYSERLIEEGNFVPIWYTEALHKSYNGYDVKPILRGWVISHSVIFSYALTSFWLFYIGFEYIDAMVIGLLGIRLPVRIITFMIVIIGLIALYFKMSNLSYSLGGKICIKRKSISLSHFLSIDLTLKHVQFLPDNLKF